MNVIVLIADSLRFDYMNCYQSLGYPIGPVGKGIETPNLDSLASESMVFDRCYSEGLPTMPTRTTWFTGIRTLPRRPWKPFEEDDRLLAEYLWNRNMRSAFVSDTWHMHEPGYNCTRGFDEAHFIRGQEYDLHVMYENVKVDFAKHLKVRGDGSPEVNRWRKLNWIDNWTQYLRNISLWPDWFESDEHHFVAQVVQRSMEVLDRYKGTDNLFFWMDSFDPHEPWDPPRSFAEKYLPDKNAKWITDPLCGPTKDYLSEEEIQNIKALYAAEVTMVDKWIGILLNYLRKNGFLDNSLLVFTTDHGELLGERGYIRKAVSQPYEELSHIPLILRHPAGLGAGKRFDGMVETTDLFPTILDFLDKEIPEDCEGYSLLPLLKGEEKRWPRRFSVSGFHAHAESIRDKEWTLIRYVGPREMTGKDRGLELYYRVEDKFEKDNLVCKEPAKVLELEQALNETLHLD